MDERKTKIALYILAGIVIVCSLVYAFTKKPEMPIEYKRAIDSLIVANKALLDEQKHLDSSIHSYEARIEQIDTQIQNVKTKTVIIKQYYHEQSQKVDHYTPTQVDSFFKARYNY